MPKSKKLKPKLYPDDHWERPPSKATGDDSAQILYMAVGQALTNWENLENQFANLFSVLVEAASSAPKRVYGSIVASHGRREALNAAAEIFFINHHTPESEQDIFHDLIANFGKASRRRDDIAHGIVFGFSLNSVPKGTFLFPPEYNTERTHPYPPPPSTEGEPETLWTEEFRYTAADIMAIAAKFFDLIPHVYQCQVRLHRLAFPQLYLQNSIPPAESQQQ